MSTPFCISFVTICACDVPDWFSSTTNCITCSSVIVDCANAHNGIKAAKTNIDRSFSQPFLIMIYYSNSFPFQNFLPLTMLAAVRTTMLKSSHSDLRSR